MERLKSYCAEVCFIDNLQTFIISPSKFDDILKDNELLMYLKKSDIVPFIKTSRAVGTNILYLAFVNLPAKVERFQWLPVHCYKNENKFYHVYYRNTWMCRECRHIMNKSIVMPMVEADSTIYHYCENKYPDIPLIFQKVKCPKCGRVLQNHLIIIK
ncbi:hypothetical protein [Clostridium sp. AN503]|uniref:hypothetical protein n=1 Tax=Clostridium sp. AN503 TaxID=3160598 RepID=UPI003458A68D